MRDLICPQNDWGPALAIHRAEQFPLQVPEAREPPITEDRTLLNDMDRIDNIELPKELKFDKETAI